MKRTFPASTWELAYLSQAKWQERPPHKVFFEELHSRFPVPTLRTLPDVIWRLSTDFSYSDYYGAEWVEDGDGMTKRKAAVRQGQKVKRKQKEERSRGRSSRLCASEWMGGVEDDDEDDNKDFSFLLCLQRLSMAEQLPSTLPCIGGSANRWRDIDRLLLRSGNFVGPGFEPGPEVSRLCMYVYA